MGASVEEKSGYSWFGLIAGLVNVVLGLLLVVSPQRSLFALAWLSGWAIIVWAVSQGIAAFRSDDRFDRTGGLVVSVITLGLGVAVVAIPEISLGLLRVLIGISAIVWGLMDAGRTFAGHSRWWGFLVRGLGSVALGLALIFAPDPTAKLIGTLLGALLLLVGVAEIAATFLLRPRQVTSG